GGMGPMVGASIPVTYQELRWLGVVIPNLFRPDVVATIAGKSTVLEATFFWDKAKDKLTPKQVRARARMKANCAQLTPDGSEGPCKCPDSALPPKWRPKAA